MKLIKPKTEILDELNGIDVLKRIELVARTCYKSEEHIKEGSAEKLVSNLIKLGHEAMLEFVDITVRFTCDRGVSHELVRHRVASYAQESTRYCNYSNEKFGNELQFIHNDIDDMNGAGAVDYASALESIESAYFQLIKDGVTPQIARAILPNCLKTEINMKCNLREWRHFFKLRCAGAAHPQMRELTIPLLEKMHNMIPLIFDDLYEQFCK